MAVSIMDIDAHQKYVVKDNHAESDYFGLVKKLVGQREQGDKTIQSRIDKVYDLIMDEIVTNARNPVQTVKFGTSGWRGILGKDLNVRSVSFVTAAIVDLYMSVDKEPELAVFLGVNSCAEAREKGVVLGFDNRFGGEVLAAAAIEVLVGAGFTVHYAGESTTGVLSAALLERGAAFSINLTPSHNPMEYGGYKYNAGDAGPAASELTERITLRARQLFQAGRSALVGETSQLVLPDERDDILRFDALASWIDFVRKNRSVHTIDFDGIVERYHQRDDMVVVVDSVHGASRLDIANLFGGKMGEHGVHLRGRSDVTFGGIAPEPSSKNLKGVHDILTERDEPLKLGAIIDPDGDRIRFTDGTTEISMNQFGAMCYHFLHETRGLSGMVAKTVATSNFANCLAAAFGEEVYEPKVGFKEFKPVIGKALVYFEESDGISIIGHTPEKDAYIGLLLALDIVLTTGKNLGDYLHELEEQYGFFFPDRDGVAVNVQGDELKSALAKLEKYCVGAEVDVAGELKSIRQIIDIDGRKMIFEDGSWLMIRPSGTEPKVRFYVESRDAAGTINLVATAKRMLAEVGLL